MIASAAQPRRGFLKKGIVGAAVLFVGGAIPIALRSTRVGPAPRTPLRLLDAREHAILSAIAARVVPGAEAGGDWPSAATLDCAGKIDALLARTQPEVGTEFKQLLALFESPLFGVITHLRPTPFSRLSPDDQDARLEAWRYSRLALLRSGYQALVRLCHAVYYASPEVYALCGYPGPPEVAQTEPTVR
jgi:hypothetical protein